MPSLKDRTEQSSKASRFWSVDTVASYCEVCNATIWRLVAAGRFPRPRKLSTQCLRFDSREVIRFLEKLPQHTPGEKEQ